MKKIKWLCLLLALVTLLTSCAVISSTVSGGDTTPPSGDETPGNGDDEQNGGTQAPTAYNGTVDLSYFKMIYARSASDLMVSNLYAYSDKVAADIGGTLRVSKDMGKANKEQDTADFEILVGPTTHKQSVEALKKLNGKQGYVVAQIDNKVVITGTSDYMVDLGWKHVYDNFIKKATEKNGSFKMDKDYCYIQRDIATEAVLGGSQAPSAYSVIYNSTLDTTEGSEYGGSGASHVSYLYKQAQNMRTKLAGMVGKNADEIRFLDDKNEQGKNGFEVIVGSTKRQISQQLLGAIGTGEFGVICQNGQIAVGAWSDDMVVNAINHLALLFDFCRDYSTGAVSFPTGEVFSAKRASYPDGVPAFEGGTLVGVVESGSGKLSNDDESATFQECYSDCSIPEYESYCSTLTGKGYALYTESQNKNTDRNTNNYFRTYKNDTNMVHVYYIGGKGIVRVVVSRLENINLPNVTKENYTKLTEPKLTQMRFSYDTGNFGLCTILTLEDGSFIIYDGGGEGKNGVDANEQDRLYNLLKELNPRSDGKIVIAAWILTHQHWDHYYNFYNFCKDYGKQNVEIEQFMCNLSSSGYKYNSHNPDGYGIKSLIEVRDKFMTKPYKIVEVHTGQHVWVRNVEVEILFTQEDMYPSPIYYFNNTTLVTRLYVHRTSAPVGGAVDGNTIVASTNSVLMLGDQNHEGCHYMLDMYGQNVKASATLKSDIVQVSHHGVNGALTELYNVAAPTLLLWPTSEKNYKSWTNGKAGGNTVCHYEGCLGDDGKVGGDKDNNHSYKVIDKRLRDKIDRGEIELILADHYNWTFEFPWAPGTNIYITDDGGKTGNGPYTPK